MQVSYALVEFKDPADALKAMKLTGLQLAGKKLVIKPRRVEPKRKERDPKTTPEQSPPAAMAVEGMSLLSQQLWQLGVHVSEEEMRQIPEVSRVVLHR